MLHDNALYKFNIDIDIDQRLLRELKEVEEEIGTLELRPPSAGGEDTFITPKPIDLSTDPPGDTGYRSFEGSYPGGGGSLLVTGPGSLTVTRPTRVEGARQKCGVVATGREDLPEARAVHRGSAEGEVIVAGTQTTPGIYSGHGRQRYVICMLSFVTFRCVLTKP